MADGKTLRVLLCDDEPGMRLILRKLVERAEGFEIVGEAEDGEEAQAGRRLPGRGYAQAQRRGDRKAHPGHGPARRAHLRHRLRGLPRRGLRGLRL